MLESTGKAFAAGNVDHTPSKFRSRTCDPNAVGGDAAAAAAETVTDVVRNVGVPFVNSHDQHQHNIQP